ncbi:lipase/acyltransferase domain-containing protein [Micromonospora sp. LOL_021]|uniref:lipase/acyltransferase domain-containing protein n=1 Tax=Micromonospora sp. LOL_021 TaxID=3345417 RepID=UPI003A8535FB
MVVVPGIMGSQLWDTQDERLVWGSAGAVVRSWLGGGPLKAMHLAPGQWEDRRPRIIPKGLITGPVWLPELRGLEPYTGLVRELARVVAAPEALRTFPYDWRLPLRHNAALLGEAVQEHLDQWRRHTAAAPDARVVLVAHSMGGLLARYFTEILGGSAVVRRTFTIGTPFYGAVKAAVMLNQGRGTPMPLPHLRVRALAATLPAVHDLLPTYRCLITPTGIRRLTEHDIVALGGDPYLARLSRDTHRDLEGAGTHGLHTVVGLGQLTAQSMTFDHDQVTALPTLPEDGGDPGLAPDRDGDETVYSESAAGQVDPLHYVCQTHGGLASTPEVAFQIVERLVGRRNKPPLGEAPAPLGLDLPDAVRVGDPFTVRVLGSADPRGTRLQVEVADTDQRVAVPDLSADRAASADQPAITGRIVLRRAGLYRVSVTRGAPSPVSQLIMALPSDVLAPGQANA